jgi:hypothetical protein
MQNQNQKLWLDPAEVAPLIGEDCQAIYRDIRLGNFPFEFVRIGRRIKISARSLGLIPMPEVAKNEGANEVACLVASTSDAPATT